MCTVHVILSWQKKYHRLELWLLTVVHRDISNSTVLPFTILIDKTKFILHLRCTEFFFPRKRKKNSSVCSQTANELVTQRYLNKITVSTFFQRWRIIEMWRDVAQHLPKLSLEKKPRLRTLDDFFINTNFYTVSSTIYDKRSGHSVVLRFV